jgi:hypothetical protein
VARKRDQATERRHMIYRDQHGRLWDASFDIMGMGSCGPKNPRGWRAPLVPPDAYLREETEKPGMFIIDYDGWINNLKERQQAFENEQALWADRLEKPPEHKAVQRMTGLGPYPFQMVQAAKAGNRWVLGKTDKVPKWAEAYRPWWDRSTITNPTPELSTEFPDAEDDHEEELELVGATPVKRGPGRPPKVPVEQ